MLHETYSFPLAFDADLVAKLLERLAPDRQSRILDPFCGTGTTLLESKLRGFSSIGVDANPVCVLVSKAKTTWTVGASEVERNAKFVIRSASTAYQSYLRRRENASGRRHTYLTDPIFAASAVGKYLISSGLIRRGWMSPVPAVKTLLIAERLWTLPERTKNFLLLSLLGLLVPEISNMSYGPEIYRARERRDCNVFGLFEERVKENLEKLRALKATGVGGSTHVRLADAANGGLRFLLPNSIDAVITSPPYLSDHDYSRLTRLELVFSGYVTSVKKLREVKQMLVRSSSKNVYKDDKAARLVKGFSSVSSVIEKVSERALQKRSGFARVYPRLIGEYFGGMYKHFQAVAHVLRAGGMAAYIVADQSSFFAVPIPSAQIIAQLAEGCCGGLRVLAMEPIGEYRGTRGAVTWSNHEWLILLEKHKVSARYSEAPILSSSVVS
jgi:DNA modification methylase